MIVQRQLDIAVSVSILLKFSFHISIKFSFRKFDLANVPLIVYLSENDITRLKYYKNTTKKLLQVDAAGNAKALL